MSPAPQTPNPEFNDIRVLNSGLGFERMFSCYLNQPGRVEDIPKIFAALPLAIPPVKHWSPRIRNSSTNNLMLGKEKA